MRTKVRLWGVAGAVVLALVATGSPAQPAFAKDRDTIEKEQQENSKKQRSVDSALEDTNAALTAAYNDLKAAEARLPQAQAELSAAQATAATAQREAETLADRLQSAQVQQDELTEEISRNQQSEKNAQQTLAQMARQAYRGDGSSASGLMFMLGAQTPQDLTDSYAAQAMVSRNQTDALTELQQAQGANTNRENRLSAVKAQITTLKQQADKKAAEAEQARQTAQARKDEIDTLITTKTELTQKLEASKAAYLSQQNALDAERAKFAQEMAALAAQEQQSRGGGGGDAPSGGQGGSGLLRAPLGGQLVVTSSYGWRIHPIYHDRRLHTGTDFAAGCGAPLYAAADGVVASARFQTAWGNQLILNHGNLGGATIMTTYNHMSRYAVGAGQHVTRGQVVGYVGTTGWSTGCHLHFEVWRNGATTNPMNYF